jgi:VIT1/CCC1 family predicted Fe2+/Mn2+ transporter
MLAGLDPFVASLARYTGTAHMRGAVQTLIIGALAAGAAYLIAKWIAYT